MTTLGDWNNPVWDGPHKRVVNAPHATGKTENVFHSVDLEQDEEVEWHFAHTLKGTFVSGYEIKKKAV